MGWMFRSHGKDPFGDDEPVVFYTSESEQFDWYAGDDLRCCSGDHSEDSPCFGNNARDAHLFRVGLLAVEAGATIILVVGIFLIWAALWGSASGASLACLMTAVYIPQWRVVRHLAFDRAFWGSPGFETYLEYLLEAEDI